MATKRKEIKLPSAAAMEALPRVERKKEDKPEGGLSEVAPQRQEPAPPKKSAGMYGERVDNLLATLAALIKDDLDNYDGKRMSDQEANNFMWHFIRSWCGIGNDPVVMLNFMWMLDPANVRVFSRMPPTTFKALRIRAMELLDEQPDADDAIRKHWEAIVGGRVPFGWKLLEARAAET